MLTRTASSVAAVECMFSTMSINFNDKRSRLTADKANRMFFIRDNFTFLSIKGILNEFDSAHLPYDNAQLLAVGIA